MFKGTPVDYKDIKITNNGFWPDLNVAEFQRCRSIPTDIDSHTVAESLLNAIGETNEKLQQVVSIHQSNGYASAAVVPGETMLITENGLQENLITSRYKKAVYALAKAELLPEYISLAAKDAKAGQDSTDTTCGLLAEHSVTVRIIIGLRRVGVSIL